MKKSKIRILITIFFLFIADVSTKWLAVKYLKSPINITSWFSLELRENFGVAWSLPIPQQIILPMNIIILFLIIIWISKNVDFRRKKTLIAVSLIIGGALGNIFDRLMFGYVIDFIKIGWWPVFNFADMFLLIGAFIFVLFYGKIKRYN